MTYIVVETVWSSDGEELEDRYWGPFRNQEQADAWIEKIDLIEGTLRVEPLLFALTNEHLAVRRGHRSNKGGMA